MFADTDTVWENYSPEYARPGQPAKPDFVGWTGLPAISVLLEDVFGLQPDAPQHTIVWDVRLLDEHGVEGYPFEQNGVVDLKCHARSSVLEKPVIEVRSTVPVKLKIHWAGGEGEVEVK